MNKIRRQHFSFSQWQKHFKQLATKDPDSSRVLNAIMGNAVPLLLYIYACGAPTTEEFFTRSGLRTRLRIADEAESLARTIDQFDRCQLGESFRTFLERYAEYGNSDDLPLIGKVQEIYPILPNLLSTLAKLLKATANDATTPRLFRPPDRKRIQTRALCMLHFHLSSLHNKSRYRTSSDIAAMIRIACMAAKTREDVSQDAVENRVRRFERAYPEECAVLKTVVEDELHLPVVQSVLLWPVITTA